MATVLLVVEYGDHAILVLLICQPQVLKQVGLESEPQRPAVNPLGGGGVLSSRP